MPFRICGIIVADRVLKDTVTSSSLREDGPYCPPYTAAGGDCPHRWQSKCAESFVVDDVMVKQSSPARLCSWRSLHVESGPDQRQ